MRFCRQLSGAVFEYDRAWHDFWVGIAPPRARTAVSFFEVRPGEGPGHRWLRAYVAWCVGLALALVGVAAVLGAFG